MPRLVLPVTTTTKAGIAPPAETDGNPSGGHTFANTGRTLLIVRNADTEPHTLTFITPGTVDGNAIADRAVEIQAGQTRYFGRLDPRVYSSALAVDADSAQLKLAALEP